MTLAMPQTPALQTQLELSIASVASKYDRDIWIGLSDRKKENDFVWEDGTSLSLSWSHWGQGDPSLNQEPQPNNFK